MEYHLSNVVRLTGPGLNGRRHVYAVPPSGLDVGIGLQVDVSLSPEEWAGRPVQELVDFLRRPTSTLDPSYPFTSPW